jgi:hypothetical protein
VAGAVLVPVTVASASHHHAAKLPLALVPLQKAQLGAAGRSLALDYDGSGPSDIPFDGLKACEVSLLLLNDGRVAQYFLDYGDGFTGSNGVMEIRTGVDEYTTRAAAKAVYLLRRRADSDQQVGQWKKIRVPAVGPRHFAYLGTWAVPNLNPIVCLDEQVLAGKFIVDLTVTAGSAKAAEHVAPRLARRLYHRFQSMLSGHLAGNPVKLPRKPKNARAAGGPDMSTMVLQPSDIGQPDADVTKFYWAVLPALSAYEMDMNVYAGPFDGDLEQQIFWWRTAKEAKYVAAYESDFNANIKGVSTVDLSAVGDNATGVISEWDGKPLVFVSLTNGRAGEYVLASRNGEGPAPTDSDVQSLAQAAANRLDAGLGP